MGEQENRNIFTVEDRRTREQNIIYWFILVNKNIIERKETCGELFSVYFKTVFAFYVKTKQKYCCFFLFDIMPHYNILDEILLEQKAF